MSEAFHLATELLPLFERVGYGRIASRGELAPVVPECFLFGVTHADDFIVLYGDHRHGLHESCVVLEGTNVGRFAGYVVDDEVRRVVLHCLRSAFGRSLGFTFGRSRDVIALDSLGTAVDEEERRDAVVLPRGCQARVPVGSTIVAVDEPEFLVRGLQDFVMSPDSVPPAVDVFTPPVDLVMDEVFRLDTVHPCWCVFDRVLFQGARLDVDKDDSSSVLSRGANLLLVDGGHIVGPAFVVDLERVVRHATGGVAVHVDVTFEVLPEVGVRLVANMDRLVANLLDQSDVVRVRRRDHDITRSTFAPELGPLAEPSMHEWSHPVEVIFHPLDVHVTEYDTRAETSIAAELLAAKLHGHVVIDDSQVGGIHRCNVLGEDRCLDITQKAPVVARLVDAPGAHGQDHHEHDESQDHWCCAHERGAIGFIPASELTEDERDAGGDDHEDPQVRPPEVDGWKRQIGQ
ncbi:MAG: hypothetical protein HHAS10_01270 [Candidatus Altimarinota bacterium]